MTREEFLKSPTLVKEYEDWIRKPIAEIAFMLVREIHRPVMPAIGMMTHPTEHLAGLYCEQSGINACIETLKSLGAPSSAGEVEADWGKEKGGDEG